MLTSRIFAKNFSVNNKFKFTIMNTKIFKNHCRWLGDILVFLVHVLLVLFVFGFTYCFILIFH